MEKSLIPTDKEQATVKAVFRTQLLAIFAIACSVALCAAKVFDYNPIVKYYTAAGMIQQPTRVWDGIITVSTASAQVVDISSAGFTNINAITITPANNTTSTISMPLTSIKSYTPTSVTFNTLVSNSGVVGVLAGLIAPSSVSGMQVHVHVDGW